MRARGVTDITSGVIIFRWHPTTFIAWIGCSRQKYTLIAAWLFAVSYSTRHKERWENKNLSGTMIEERARVSANEFAVWVTMGLESWTESKSGWFSCTQHTCNLWNLSDPLKVQIHSSSDGGSLELQWCEDDYCLSVHSIIDTWIRTSSHFNSPCC